MILTAWEEGQTGLKMLFGWLLVWRVGRRWYLFLTAIAAPWLSFSLTLALVIGIVIATGPTLLTHKLSRSVPLYQ